MDKVIQGICYSFSRLFQRVERYTIIVVLMGILLFSGKITPTEAFDTSAFDTLRLGDQITSDMLEQLRAFQAILNQPISLGLLVRGGEGPPGPPGSPGNTGGRGTMGDQGPVGENGSAGIEGSFGKTGAPGPPGEPGTPGYERTYDGNVNYANEERNDRGNYGNEEASNPSAQERNYSTDQSVSEETKFFCEGERSWIGCNQNEKINITNAFWGRDDFVTCSQSVPSNHSTRQYSLDYDHVLMKVEGICNWRPTCEFYATRLFLDDVTDLQVYKYLRVGYECIPEVYDKDNFGERRGNTEEQLSGMRNDTTLWTQ